MELNDQEEGNSELRLNIFLLTLPALIHLSILREKWLKRRISASALSFNFLIFKERILLVTGRWILSLNILLLVNEIWMGRELAQMLLSGIK